MSARWRLIGLIVAVLATSLSVAYVYFMRSPVRRHTLEARVEKAVRGVIPPRLRGHITDHVIIVSVDGLRPDAIAAYAPETMSRVAREGAMTLAAQTTLPSQTLPSHASMLTGTPPDIHGITWNTDSLLGARRLRVPTIFTLAKDAGLETAAFFSKSKFHQLEVLPSLDYSQSPSGGWGKLLADRTGDDVERYLARERPNLLFVHLGDPDYAGHAIGWMTRAYGLAVRSADDALEDILDAANTAFGPGNYVLILTADHGGQGRGHRSATRTNSTIPWIVWGTDVRSGTRLPSGVRTMDTAATALWLLGLDLPAHMIGTPVTSAFLSATAP